MGAHSAEGLHKATDAQLHFFATQGYAVFPGLLQGEALESIRATVSRDILSDTAGRTQAPDAGHWNSQGFLRSDAVGGRIYKVQAVAKYVPDVLGLLFRAPQVVERVRQVYRAAHPGAEPAQVDVFGTKFFPMWPAVGRSVHWHQDSHYFGSEASPMVLSCAVYLEDTDRENGCFRMVPGSHLGGPQPHTPGVGEWAEGEWMHVDDSVAVDVEVPAGSVVLFDARLVHSAHPNSSPDRSRWSFFGHYVPRDLQFSWRGVDYSSGAYDDRHMVY